MSHFAFGPPPGNLLSVYHVATGNLIKTYNSEYGAYYLTITPNATHFILTERQYTYVINLETGEEVKQKGVFVISNLDDGRLYDCQRSASTSSYVVSSISIIANKILKTKILSVPNPCNKKKKAFVGGRNYFILGNEIYTLQGHKISDFSLIKMKNTNKILRTDAKLYNSRLFHDDTMIHPQTSQVVSVNNPQEVLNGNMFFEFGSCKFLNKKVYGVDEPTRLVVKRILDNSVALDVPSGTYLAHCEEYLAVHIDRRNINIYDIRTFKLVSTMAVRRTESYWISFPGGVFFDVKRDTLTHKLLKCSAFYDINIKFLYL